MRTRPIPGVVLLTAITVPALLALRADAASPFGPPQAVRKSYPAQGMQAVRTDPVAVQFRRPVDLATLEGGSFRLLSGVAPSPGEAEGPSLPGSFALALSRKGKPIPRQVIFTPDSPLDAGATYTVVLDQGASTVRGAGMEDSFFFTFVTAGDKPVGEVTPLDPATRLVKAPRQGPPPRVQWTFPNTGLGNVFTDPVEVHFSRPLDGRTVNGTTVQVLTDGNPVPGSLSHPANGDPRVVRFDPSTPLFPGSNFEIRVTREVRSDRGRAMKEEFRGAFGTSPFKEGVRPVLPEDFSPGPWMHQGRAFHSASPLEGGDVLVAGGQDYEGNPLASAEVFDRAETAFVQVLPMAEARRKHAAVVLKSGKVLVCGGFGAGGGSLASVELYDPITGSWSPAPPMAGDRAHHTATLLPSGKVFVAGGYRVVGGGLQFTTTHEVFDPVANAWSAGPAPVARRGGHTATLLNDGRVLLAGGAQFGQAVAEVYDPAKGTLTRTAEDPAEHRLFHAAALTKSGGVLLAGGGPGPAELFDPATGTFHGAGSSPVTGLPSVESPYYCSLTPIPGGRVALLGGLAVGGGTGGTDLVLSMVQLWDSRSGSGYGAFFPMVFDMVVPRAAHTVTPLGDGRFLLAGGFGSSGQSLGNERRSTLFLPSQ